jgi:hypothetical protein
VLGLVLLITIAFWPMMVLVVALGGMRSLIRFDLIAITIVKTLPIYVVVVLLVYAGVVGPGLLVGAVRGSGAEDGSGIGASGASLGAEAAFYVVMVYTNIVTMRVIGLYYHHFKHRFAWSWG